MKRTIPIFITMLSGIILIVSNFIPATVSWGEAAAIWFDVLAGIAFLLGGANLVRVHLKKVSDRHAGWGYSLIILGSFFLTLGIGMAKFGVKPASNAEFYGETFAKIPLEELPEEFIYKTKGFVPPRFEKLSPEERYFEIPASSRRQFSITSENEFVFKGWMSPSQYSDLSSLSDIIDWKAAIEELKNKAVAPKELNSKVAHHSDHHAISISGILTKEEEKALLDFSKSESWKNSIKQAVKLSSSKREFTPGYFIDNPRIPDDLKERVTLEKEKFSVIGPLSDEEVKSLAQQFPIVRPVTSEYTAEFIAKLNELNKLNEKQIKFITEKLKTYDFNITEIIEQVNSLGDPTPSTKPFKVIKEERDNGAAEIVRSIPSNDEVVHLNKDQIDAFKKFAESPDMMISDLIAQLKEKGKLLPAQENEFKRVLSTVFTKGKRDRDLCIALYQVDSKNLTRSQIKYLMADYKKELSWGKEMHNLLVGTNPVKYAWSGEYDRVGTPFNWIYEYIFSPLQSTVFAMLAFYVASAAFRAFRAKNMEAILLLSTAFIILLGRTYIGGVLSDLVPSNYYLYYLKIENITDWIMKIPYTAGGRAVMIGIALGVISTSIKVLLGIDRSFLGGDD